MARQYLEDAGPTEAAIADPLAANTATTAVLMWEPGRFTPIFAYSAVPAKTYIIEAGGLITTAATGALTISPFIGTSATAVGANTLGASIAQTVPASSLSGPWYLKLTLICTGTGAVGANANLKGTGFFISGGVAATANSGLQVTFGGTAGAFDHTLISYISMQKTLSVAGSFTTQWVTMSIPN